MSDSYHRWDVSFKPLVFGFLLSVALILTTYLIAVEHYLNGWLLICSIGGLAGLQALIQFIFFLRLGIEPKPYWNMTTFLFMVGVVVVVVGGSLWIMYNLNYHMSMSS